MTARREHLEWSRCARRSAWVASLVLLGCTGSIDMNRDDPGTEGPGTPADPRLPGVDPSVPDPGSPSVQPSDPQEENWQPTPDCNPILPRRVTRLSDRHLANALADLFGAQARPDIQTVTGTIEDFIPNKAAAVGGAVASKLHTVVESLAADATRPGRPAVTCSADERACARDFIADFATRAFRRPLEPDEQARLMTVYDAGRTELGTHADGIRNVMHAVAQSTSFLYQTELGTEVSPGRYALTAHELAAKIAFFLTDTLPDAQLRMAARSGALDTEAGVRAEVERLLATPAARRNVEAMFQRFFHLDRIAKAEKSAGIPLTPALRTSMQEELRRLLADVLWSRDARLPELLTTRRSFADPALAALYGVPHPGGSGFAPVTLPSAERAGILTSAGLMAMEATPDDSSAVHRGVFIVRDLLCFHPPAPSADDLAQADALFMNTFTERQRAEKRAAVARCGGCHAFFDPYGVHFENYDTMGRYRTTYRTPNGEIPVDASWEASLYDVRGLIRSGVEAAARFAQSRAVNECMARQLASYAIGQRLTDEQACTVSALGRRLGERGGDLLALVADVAAWPGLRNRKDGGAP